MRIIRTVPMHPLLAAVLPILLIYSGNVDETSLGSLARPVAVMLIGCLLLWAPIALALKSVPKAGVIVSLSMVMFFSFGALVQIARGRFVLATMVVVLMGVTYLLARTRGRLIELTTVLNTFALCIAAVVTVSMTTQLTRPSVTVTPTATAEERPVRQLENPPDIYYIILDGYGRADILRDVYGFDNSEFLDQLRQRGFRVCERSLANYPFTILSLPSSLNMCYLNELAQQVGSRSSDRGPLWSMLNHSHVAHLLRRHGYRFVSFASWFSVTENLAEVDDYFGPGLRFSDFERAIMWMTPLPHVAPTLYNPFNAQRRVVLFALDRLAEPRKQEQPVFVYAHIMCPHPPFVFDSNGMPAEAQQAYADGEYWGFYGGTTADHVGGYRNQVAFINQSIIDAIDRIQAAAEEPAIIVLQGDHGPALKIQAQAHVDSGVSSHGVMNQRLPILNAYLVPQQIGVRLYDDITPVNTFRLILNEIGVGEYELLDDRSYSSEWEHPYDFLDVTDELRARSED